MEARGRGSMWGNTVRCVLSGLGALVIVPAGLYLNLGFWRVPLAVVRRYEGMWSFLFFFFLRRRKNQGQWSWVRFPLATQRM